ncbi:MAG: serine--tRNA ligase [Patescibacteria group bacterium]|nr:serine--tRNA ligase [Patescibacteria group bacterium]
MLDADFIKKNKDLVIQSTKNKNRQVDIERIIDLDEKKGKLIFEIQKLRNQRNRLAKKKPTPSHVSEGRLLKEQIKVKESQLREIDSELESLISHVPNVVFEEIPIGPDASYNLEVKRWGQPRKFDFLPKSHLQLGLELDIIDFDRGAKISGFRGYFLKNEGAILHLAIIFWAFQKLVIKGYQPIIPPAIVKKFTLFGSGQFPWGETEVYKLNDDDAYLAGTAEVPVTAYFANEILNENELPKKFVALSPCYRREAGSYGKDRRGLYRVHEFLKVEQVIIAQNDRQVASTLHEELQENTESLLEELNLCYRRVLLASGEMGEPQAKKYDTEVWMPYRNDWGEVASNSIMTDFQSRRLNIRYRKKTGKAEFCFTLNNTAIASPRILIALLENNQQSDGSIIVPKVLRPLTGFKVIKKKPNH